jgi:hypothetical protein
MAPKRPNKERKADTAESQSSGVRGVLMAIPEWLRWFAGFLGAIAAVTIAIPPFMDAVWPERGEAERWDITLVKWDLYDCDPAITGDDLDIHFDVLVGKETLHSVPRDSHEFDDRPPGPLMIEETKSFETRSGEVKVSGSLYNRDPKGVSQRLATHNETVALVEGEEVLRPEDGSDCGLLTLRMSHAD